MAPKKAVEEQFAQYLRTREPNHLAAVFEALKPELTSAARRAGLDEQGAEDVVQETFLGVIKAEDRFEPDKPFMPWVRGIALRQINAERRRRARLQMLFRSSSTELEEREADDVDFDSTELRRQIQQALRFLSERNRIVVHAALFDGLSVDELSERFNLTKTAASVRLHRGLAQLREQLGRSSSWGLLGFLPLRWRMGWKESTSAKSVVAVAMLAAVGNRVVLNSDASPEGADAMESQEGAALEESSLGEEPEREDMAALDIAGTEASTEPLGTTGVDATSVAPLPATVTGVVVRANGAPAPAGVEVFVLRTTPSLVLPTAPMSPSATTDAEGHFTVDATALGDDPSPLLMARYSGQVGWTDVQATDIADGTFPPMTLAPEARIEANVVDVNGLPIEGASLAGFTQHPRFMAPVEEMSLQFGFLAVKPYRHLFGATSNEGGVGIIGGLFGAEAPSIISVLSVSKEGYATAMQALQGPGSEPFKADVVLRRLSSLSCAGRVLDEDGAPLPRGTASFLVRGEAVTGNTAAVRVEPSADWSVPNALLDEYPFVLRFECEGYCSEDISVEQAEGLSGELHLVSLTRESPFKVQVRNEAGRPLAGVELSIATSGAMRTVVTDEHGTHSFRGLRKGNRKITATYGAAGEELRSATKSFGPESSEVTLVLPEVAGRIERLEVVAPDGSGWKFADLRAQNIDGFEGSLTPAQMAGESAVFEAIPEGQWVFSGLTLSGEPCVEKLQLPFESDAGSPSLKASPIATGEATCLISPSTTPAGEPLNFESCTVALRRSDLPNLPRWMSGGRRVAWLQLSRNDDPSSVISLNDLSVGQWTIIVLGKGWASAPMAFEVSANGTTRLDIAPVPAGTASFVRPSVVSSGLARFEIRDASAEAWQVLGLIPFGHEWPEPSETPAPEGQWQWRATLQAQDSQGNFTDIYPVMYGAMEITANSTTTIDMATAAIAPLE